MKRMYFVVGFLCLVAAQAHAAHYALVDQSGVTRNVIEWDGVSPYTPPAGMSLVPAASAPAYVPIVAPPTAISKSAFLARFTTAELTAISAAARANDAVNVWLITAEAADQIDLTDPKTKAGLDALVAAGLLTGARETAVLTP